MVSLRNRESITYSNTFSYSLFPKYYTGAQDGYKSIKRYGTASNLYESFVNVLQTV